MHGIAFLLLLWLSVVTTEPPTTDANENDLLGLSELLGSGRAIFDAAANRTSTDTSSQCVQDLLKAQKGIVELAPWALKMADSMEKFTCGLLQGRLTYIGNYDECLSVNEGTFKGKHCMMEVHLSFEVLPRRFKVTPIDHDDNPLFPPLPLLFGICIPSTCTGRDITDMLAELPVNVTINEKNCWTDDPVTLTQEDWLVVCGLLCVAFIAVFSTIYDVLNKAGQVSSGRRDLYASFSLYSNWKNLVRVSTGPGNIGCLHGIRTLTMCWIVLGHEYAMSSFSPSINSFYVLDYFMDKQKLLITNALVSVDTFFFLSGMLVTIVFFRDISKKKYYDVPIAMIHRFIRITPAFAVMVLIQSTIIERLGRGPMWYPSMSQGIEMCRKNWWSGLLYIGNIVEPTSTCLGQSWYLSADMQMFWLSPILLYPILLWPKFAPAFYSLALAASLSINFGISFDYNLGPHIFFTNNKKQFEIDYVQSYMRLTPYIVGMALGYVVCGIKSNRIRIVLSRLWVTLGWTFSTIVCLSSIYSLSYFIDHNTTYTTVESSSYLTFHRLGWSLGLAWIILACTSGYGGPVNRILSWNGFQFFGKLSYSIFLVHFTIQMFKVGMLRTNTYISDYDIVTSYFGNFVYSLAFSVVLYMFFEAPFINLDRYFLSRVKILPYPRIKTTLETGEGVDNKGFDKS